MNDTQVLTLTDFLLARIAEDEAVAEAATEVRFQVGRHDRWDYDGNPSGYVAPIGCAASSWDEDHDGGRQARHIATHDPARVLAECEAKRRIVERGRLTEAWIPTTDERSIGAINANRFTLQHLALPYADHPDYREEWRP